MPRNNNLLKCDSIAEIVLYILFCLWHRVDNWNIKTLTRFLNTNLTVQITRHLLKLSALPITMNQEKLEQRYILETKGGESRRQPGQNSSDLGYPQPLQLSFVSYSRKLIILNRLSSLLRNECYSISSKVKKKFYEKYKSEKHKQSMVTLGML